MDLSMASRAKEYNVLVGATSGLRNFVMLMAESVRRWNVTGVTIKGLCAHRPILQFSFLTFEFYLKKSPTKFP